MKSKKTSIEKQFLNMVTFNKLLKIDNTEDVIYINFLHYLECIKYGKLLETDYGFYCENPGLHHRILITKPNLAAKSITIYTNLDKDIFTKGENLFFYDTFDRTTKTTYKHRHFDYIQRDINVFDKVEWDDLKEEYKVIETYTFEKD